ncbi:MAG: type II secretion system F family protein [Alphaproteobacteria bacterium]|nr:type II secretion system F family protein [Alphaproteobacteria bacterium]MCB9792993.1 type II secretion system F family protein [Alphaproteobacteria bacterium]
MSGEGFLLTPYWDLMTGVRGVTLALMIVAWAAVGWMAAPWVKDTFLRSTSGYVDWMIETFDKMFMEVTRQQCIAAILISMGVSGLLAWVLTSGMPDGWGYAFARVLLVIFFILGPGLPLGHGFPRFAVNQLWAQRVSRIEEQMLDALNYMSNGLKSGLSLIQCLDMVREELPAPISQEFGLVINEQRLGVPLEDALINLEKRIGTEDLQIMVTSIIILRQSGGNLSETFDTISVTIRERKKVQGRIKTLTAQGVSQGVIIVALPFVLGFVLYLMDPVLMSRMWTTALGWVMLAFMVFLQVVGAAIIKRVVTIRV